VLFKDFLCCGHHVPSIDHIKAEKLAR